MRESDRDDCLGMAAEVAFTMMLAFVQALILTVAILSILGAKPEVFNSILYFLGSFLPYEIYNVIRNQIVEIAQTEKGGIIVFSSMGTTWTMSTLMVTIKKSIQRAYNIKETRPYWKVRLLSVLLGITAVCLIALILNLFIFGLQIAKFLESNGHSPDIGFYLRVFHLPFAFLATTALSTVLYRAMPNVRQQLLEVLPGAIFFTSLWFLFTYCFGIYVSHIPLYNTTYGALGTFLILLMWMYLTSLSLLIGGEVNAEFHRLRTLISPQS